MSHADITAEPAATRDNPTLIALIVVVSLAGLCLLFLTLVEVFRLGWTPLEVIATVTGAGSVWLLARNSPLGWGVGLVSVAAFAVVFYQVSLYGEVAIQVFYFATSLQAIWIWVRRKDGKVRPVTDVPRKVAIGSALAGLGAWAVVWVILHRMGGGAPGWDSLTTVGSVIAHVWLVFRYAQSWWIWVALDVIYVPLYLSRGLSLTAGLYVVFLAMATVGLVRFRKEAADTRRRGVEGLTLSERLEGA